MKSIRTLILALVLIAPLSAQAATKYTFRKGQVVKGSNGKLCGVIGNNWKPVKKSGSKYVIDSKGGTRCAKLIAPNALRRTGLAKLPSAASLLKAKSGGTARAVIGTPPAVKDIPSAGVKNMFWSAGLIDAIKAGTPTEQQCDEFFSGSTDGSSAGMLGCYSVQSIAYSFQSILEGGNSACFMRNMPTAANLASGGVQVVSGELPNGDITNLFAAPPGSNDRLIKIQIGNFGLGSQTGFIKVDSTNKLGGNGLQYAHTLWFCQEGESQPSNYERTTVSLSGEFKQTGVQLFADSEFRNEISALLAKSGSGFSFSVDSPRSAKTSGEFGEAKFKSAVTILPSNIISSKVKELFGGSARESYSLASFSGTGIANFTVRSAALKESFTPLIGPPMTHSAGVEFRTPQYVSAPGITLVEDLDDVNLDTDTFFSDDASVTPDFEGKSCTATPDITLQMNFAVPSMMQIAQLCMNERLGDMDFCRGDDDVNTAMFTCLAAGEGDGGPS